MSIKIWAFQDASGRVRVTATDPTAVLAPRQIATADAPGGFMMRDLRKFFEGAESTLAGQSGEEVVIEFTLGDLSAEALISLMTPPPDTTDGV